MDLDRLTSLLRDGAPNHPERSPACPDETWIAGYVDGGLDAAVRQQLERHLADCGRCLALVGMLSRERQAEATEPVTAQVMALARGRISKAPERRWRAAPRWAAAATIVLAVPLLVQIGRNVDRGAEGQGRPAPATVRSFDSTPDALQVLVPDPGGVLEPQRAQFRWSTVAGSPYYDVRIVTDDGDVVVRERVTGTAWQLPAGVQLRPGAEYFVHIDAYPSGDKAVSSEHVPFRVAD